MAASEPSRGPEPLYAYLRLAVSLLLMTTGSVGMYATVVVMKPLAAEFGSTRSAAAIAYAVTMIGFGRTKANLTFANTLYVTSKWQKKRTYNYVNIL